MVLSLLVTSTGEGTPPSYAITPRQKLTSLPSCTWVFTERLRASATLVARLGRPLHQPWHRVHCFLIRRRCCRGHRVLEKHLFPLPRPPPVFSPPSPSPTVFPSLPGYVRLALDVSQVSHFLSVREQTAWVTEQSPILSAIAHTFIHRGVETLLRQEQNAQSDCA